MFKAIWHEKQILIVLLWSVLIFIGYNVLTVEAKESDDKKVCEEYNGEWKKIDKFGTKSCKFDNDKDAQIYSIRPGFSKDGTSSDSEYGREDLGEITATNIEHDICHNEDADSTDIKLCMSDKREQQLNNIEKACDKAGLKLNKKGECDAKGDEDNADKFYEELDQIEKETGEPRLNEVEEEGQSFGESEPVEQIEDWKNEVEIKEGPPPIPPETLEEGYEHKIGSPVIIQEKSEDYDPEENVDRSYEYEGENEATETEEEQEFEEQEFQAEEEDDEAEDEEESDEDEPEEDNSDSESEEGDE